MYKIIICLLAIFMVNQSGFAQNTPYADGVKKQQLPIVVLPPNVSVHFISPEPIQYVDISTKDITGDLPLKNVLRIKLRDSLKKPVDAVITIAGEKFIVQYQVKVTDSITIRDVVTNIEILPSQIRPLDIAGIGLSQPQLKAIALNLFTQRPCRPKEHSKAFGIKGYVNHLYAAGDYFFLDLGYLNKTNLSYNIDEFRFKVDDKKVTRASTVQSVEIKPEYFLYDTPVFKKYYRNIFVFKKITFPGNKVLHIELNEKQLSGRIVTLNISYKDVLEADIIPLK